MLASASRIAILTCTVAIIINFNCSSIAALAAVCLMHPLFVTHCSFKYSMNIHNYIMFLISPVIYCNLCDSVIFMTFMQHSIQS